MLQEECAERVRLIDAYGERAAQLARVIQTLTANSGDIRDSIIVNQSRSRCEEALRALEEHVSEHGCGPLIRSDQIKS